MEKAFCEFTVNILKKYIPNYSSEQYWLDSEEAVKTFAPRTRPFIFWKNFNNNIDFYKSIQLEFKKLKYDELNQLILMNGIDIEIRKLSKHFAIIFAGQYGSNIYDLLKKIS